VSPSSSPFFQYRPVVVLSSVPIGCSLSTSSTPSTLRTVLAAVAAVLQCAVVVPGSCALNVKSGPGVRTHLSGDLVPISTHPIYG
jgi:hypothetical protein